MMPSPSVIAPARYSEPAPRYRKVATYEDVDTGIRVQVLRSRAAYANSGISALLRQNSDTNAGVHILISGNTVYNNAEIVPNA